MGLSTSDGPLVLEQCRGQVALAGVGQAGPRWSCPRFRGAWPAACAAHTAAPDEMPTSTPSLWPIGAAGGKGVVVLHGDDLVIDRWCPARPAQSRRRCPESYAHRPVPLLSTGEEAGSTATTLTAGFLLLEELANAGHGAAGANACYKDIDLAVGIFPDLGAGSLDVCLRVGGVHELAGE